MKKHWKVSLSLHGTATQCFKVHLKFSPDYKKALELDPSQPNARQAMMVGPLHVSVHCLARIGIMTNLILPLSLQYLPDKVKEQQEKLKAEMLGKSHVTLAGTEIQNLFPCIIIM